MLKFGYSESDFQRSLDLQGTDGETFRAYMERKGITVAEARANFFKVCHLHSCRSHKGQPSDLYSQDHESMEPCFHWISEPSA